MHLLLQYIVWFLSESVRLAQILSVAEMHFLVIPLLFSSSFVHLFAFSAQKAVCAVGVGFFCLDVLIFVFKQKVSYL